MTTTFEIPKLNGKMVVDFSITNDRPASRLEACANGLLFSGVMVASTILVLCLVPFVMVAKLIKG